MERRYKKLGGKSNWFRKKKKKEAEKVQAGRKRRGGKRKRGIEEETDIETVMFVPHTPGGKLLKMLEDEDERYRKGTKMKRIKFVERGGTTIMNILGRKNPWAREGCDREDCLPCSEEKGKGGNCQQGAFASPTELPVGNVRKGI